MNVTGDKSVNRLHSERPAPAAEDVCRGLLNQDLLGIPPALWHNLAFLVPLALAAFFVFGGCAPGVSDLPCVTDGDCLPGLVCASPPGVCKVPVDASTPFATNPQFGCTQADPTPGATTTLTCNWRVAEGDLQGHSVNADTSPNTKPADSVPNTVVGQITFTPDDGGPLFSVNAIADGLSSGYFDLFGDGRDPDDPTYSIFPNGDGTYLISAYLPKGGDATTIHSTIPKSGTVNLEVYNWENSPNVADSFYFSVDGYSIDRDNGDGDDGAGTFPDFLFGDWFRDHPGSCHPIADPGATIPPGAISWEL